MFSKYQREAVQFSRHDTGSPADDPYLRHGMGLQVEKFGKDRFQLPQAAGKMLDRNIFTVGEIVTEWKSLLLSLWEQNPELKILFTVSPIRHWKDGAHGNQLSKATLLLAIDALQKEFPEHTAYFPAYEIMMDELRDYRFYADDMLHPSPAAIEYIWERFTGSMLSPDSLSIIKEWKDIQKAINHKPFQPESEAYKRFISQTLLKMERLNEKFPYFDMTNEVEMIKKKF